MPFKQNFYQVGMLRSFSYKIASIKRDQDSAAFYTARQEAPEKLAPVIWWVRWSDPSKIKENRFGTLNPIYRKAFFRKGNEIHPLFMRVQKLREAFHKTLIIISSMGCINHPNHILVKSLALDALLRIKGRMLELNHKLMFGANICDMFFA